MNAPADRFVEEFKVLRRGYGLGATNLAEQAGPALRELCGAEDDDGVDELRDKLTAVLRELVDGLPPRIQPLMRLTFALDGNSDRLQARVAAHARTKGQTERTVMRHIDEATKTLAEHATRFQPGIPDAHSPSWRIKRLQVFLNYDLPVPEVVEIRQIEVLRNDLTEMDLEMTLTPLEGWHESTPLEHMGVDLFHGGRLTGSALKGANRVAFQLQLAEPLQRGQKHEYAIRISLPDSRLLPLYMCTPRHRCDFFDLHIRFAKPPRHLWRVPGLSPLQLDDPHGRQPMTADRFGDVHTTFTNLEAHLSYGVGWTP